VGFDSNLLYEFDIDLGTILINTTINDYSLSKFSKINFPNKIITGLSKENDLVFINYYDGRMEMNFTELATINGIILDKNL
jgi:hypothetical protein